MPFWEGLAGASAWGGSGAFAAKLAKIPDFPFRIMNWYYTDPRGRRGPIDQSQLLRLVGEDIIGPETLMWQVGWPDWVPYKDCGAQNAGVSGSSACFRCHGLFPSGAMVTVNGEKLCHGCQAPAVQGMREGRRWGGQAEETRRKLINQEASIRTVGFLKIIWGFICLVRESIQFVADWQIPQGEPKELLPFFVGLAVGTLILGVGIGLRKLDSRVRVVAALMETLGLLAIPLYPVLAWFAPINLYIMWLVLNPRGKFIFSEEYKEVIAQTPQVKAKTAIITWVLLAIVLALFVGALAFIYFRIIR